MIANTDPTGRDATCRCARRGPLAAERLNPEMSFFWLKPCLRAVLVS
jgi:hypothetical protein